MNRKKIIFDYSNLFSNIWKYLISKINIFAYEIEIFLQAQLLKIMPSLSYVDQVA